VPVNRMDAAFTAEQQSKAKAALTALTDALPFLIGLGDGDRAAMVNQDGADVMLKDAADRHATWNLLPAG